jgi:hypothetical protein
MHIAHGRFGSCSGSQFSSVCFHLKPVVRGTRITVGEVLGFLAADIDALDARLMRNGYNTKILCELLNSKQTGPTKADIIGPGELRYRSATRRRCHPLSLVAKLSH